MSVALPIQLFETLSFAARQKIANDCTVTSESTRESIECFAVNNQYAYLPKYYMEQYVSKLLTKEKEEKKEETMSVWKRLSVTTTTFQLREYQLEVKREVDPILQNFHSVILSLHCGWGKSYYAILTALELSFQTLVTVYRVSHLEQWRASIKSVNSKLRVQILENKTVRDPDADFYLILGENLAHRSFTEFESVGTFIIDECHMFCTPSMSQAFLRVQPSYTIGLSATPFRTDKLDAILQVHIGYSIIRRKLYRYFNVYKYETGLKPSTRETERGKLDWSFVINSQATNDVRNQSIVKICQYFQNRTIMILTKRVELHGKKLLEMLHAVHESVDLFAGTDQTYDRDARILIATYSKAGVGFDNPKLDMLIVAGDVEEMFEQYMGRVFRPDYH